MISQKITVLSEDQSIQVDYDAYLFDLDGTIYLGDTLLPGVKQLLDSLRERGKTRIFLSNNPTKSPSMYMQKLTKLGIECDEHEIVNTIVSTVGWLQKNRPFARVFPISDEPLKEALKAASIQITEDPEQIDVVIASYDHGFDYRKLQIAFDALWQFGKAELITTNPDRYCPFPSGRGEPDAAAVVAALEAATGVSCSFNMGKPDQIMIEVALSRMGPGPHNALMVGDRLATDIQMAINAGIDSALVLTGDSQLSDLEQLEDISKPTYVLQGLSSLLVEDKK